MGGIEKPAAATPQAQECAEAHSLFMRKNISLKQINEKSSQIIKIQLTG